MSKFTINSDGNVQELQRFLWNYTPKQLERFKELVQMEYEAFEEELRLIAAAKRYQMEAALRAAGYTWKAGRGGIWELIGVPNPGGHVEAAPCDDHGMLFYKDGKPVYYLSMPYGSRMSKIVEFAEKWDLDVIEDAKLSIWFPGRTSGIKYRRKDRI